MVINEVTAIPALVLVVVGLGDDLVGEKLVLSELEDQAETGLVEVLHADVDQGLESALIAVGDHLGKGDLVLHGREPELGNTADLTAVGGALVLDSGALRLVLILLAGLDEVLGGLGLAVDDGGTLLIERGELGEEFLLELKDLLLELGLELGVLFLDALETGDTALDLGRERLNVAGRLANEGTETALDQRHEAGVVSKDGSGSDTTTQILCVMQNGQFMITSQILLGRNNGGVDGGDEYEPSLMLATPGCWACDEMGAAFKGVF